MQIWIATVAYEYEGGDTLGAATTLAGAKRLAQDEWDSLQAADASQPLVWTDDDAGSTATPDEYGPSYKVTSGMLYARDDDETVRDGAHQLVRTNDAPSLDLLARQALLAQTMTR